MTLPHAFDTDDSPERPKVLLVDDDEVNLMLTAVALRERGFGITEAASGERALALLTDPFVRTQATFFAKRCLAEVEHTPAAQVRHAYVLALTDRSAEPRSSSYTRRVSRA